MIKKNRFFGKLSRQGHIVFNSGFLRNLSHLEAYEFLQLCHRRTYKPAEYIYHQGDPGNGFYIIESGKVELIVEAEGETDANTFIPLESPQSFGNLSLYHEMRRMSSARAVEETILLGFFSADFDTLKKRYPQIAIKVLGEINRMMATQLAATIRVMSSLSSEAEAYRLQFETFYAPDETDALF
jgi:CRP-like cAMP-binding protein